jgi:hypothetical protein
MKDQYRGKGKHERKRNEETERERKKEGKGGHLYIFHAGKKQDGIQLSGREHDVISQCKSH